MNYEEEINKLKSRLDNFQQAFLQSQKNQVPVTAKTDDTASRVTEITPWTASKTAYIDDTEVTFTDVPQGSMSVYMDTPHTYVRDGSRVAVHFEPLEEVIEVTISII